MDCSLNSVLSFLSELSNRGWCLLAGGVFAAASFLFIFLLSSTAVGFFIFGGIGRIPLFFGGVLGAFILGSLSWRMLLMRKETPSTGNGLLAGGMVVLILYPVIIGTAPFISRAAVRILRFVDSTAISNLLIRPDYFSFNYGLFDMIVGTILGIVITGWMTVPIGATVGYLVARLQRTATAANAQ